MIIGKSQRQRLQKIIFEEGDESEALRLPQKQKQHLKKLLAQKIAFEAVYKKSYPQPQIKMPQHVYQSPSFLSYLCCCFYPEYYADTFEISGQVFADRFFRTFIFWREDFLQNAYSFKEQPKPAAKKQKIEPKTTKNKVTTVKPTDIPELIQIKEIKHNTVVAEIMNADLDVNQQKNVQNRPDLYGPLWLTITYIIFLALCSNLNQYFANGSKQSYKFKQDYLTSALLMTFFIRTVQIFIYPALVGCLDGEMHAKESAFLVGYSLILYFFPTLACSIPYRQIHTISLIIAGLVRATFLSKNYSSRVIERKGMIYFLVFSMEILYFFLIRTTFFNPYYKPGAAPILATRKVAAPLVMNPAVKRLHFLRTFEDQFLHQ